MAFEKSKVLKAADKFLSQGNIKAAIKEYRQIVDNDDEDLTALNMLGDLQARAGDKEGAVECFTRIAEHYREQQFRLKAIAMYKKIEKLKPRDPATAFKLAELYDAQGLMVDARAQYLIVADAYTRAGETKQTLKILHKIADLDPQNTEIRLKLAAGYVKENMVMEAAKAYAEAGRRFLEKGDFERALSAFGKAREFRPNDIEILKGVVSAHAGMGTSEDAAEILEKAVADDPEEAELVSMLAHAYVEAGNAPGAERATARMMARDASEYRRYIEVARVYLNSGDENETARVLSLIIEQMLAGREENDLLELVTEMLARNPEHIAGLRLLARIHWWQRDMEKLRSALERLAESAQVAGEPEEERYALTQLVRLAPDEQKFADRLNELGGSIDEVTEGALVEDSMDGVPTFENVGEVEAEVAEVPAAEFVWNSVAEEPFRDDANSSFADLNDGDVQEATSDIPVMPETEEPPATEDHFVFNTDDTGSVASQPATSPNGADAPKAEVMMQQELESVDFYITQGYTDIALDTLDLLERQFGSHPEIDSRRNKLQGTGTPGTEAPAEFSVELLNDEPAVADEIVEAQEMRVPEAIVIDEKTEAAAGIDSGLAEIFEEFRLEAEGDQVSSNEDFETHYNMATAYKEMDLLDEAIREFQTAAGLTAPSDGTSRYFQCCNMLGHCFVQKTMPRAAVLWFKKGLDAPGRTPDEYKALQYELGSAYEQMDDLTRAIGAFTEVYGVDVGYRDIGEKLQELQARQPVNKKKKKK